MNRPLFTRRRTEILFLLLSIAGLACITPVRAQENPAQDQEENQAPAQDDVSWYQVEVIVFAYSRPDTDGESWYENPGLPHEPNAIDLLTASVKLGAPGPPATSPAPGQDGNAPTQARLVPYLEMPPDQNRLDEVYHILTISGAYRPLYHASWQQPELDEDHALYVHLHADRGGNTDVPEAATTRAGENGAADGMDAAGTAAVPAYSAPEPAFDAMLRVRASHFLHLDVDAAYFPEDPAVLHTAQDADPDRTAYNRADYVRLTESRRIRLKELHYFDHPLFGVIVQVTRLEKDEKSE